MNLFCIFFHRMEQNECECPCECPLEVNECTGNLTNAENRWVQVLAAFKFAASWHEHSLNKRTLCFLLIRLCGCLTRTEV